jgi:hypothetical protein
MKEPAAAGAPTPSSPPYHADAVLANKAEAGSAAAETESETAEPAPVDTSESVGEAPRAIAEPTAASAPKPEPVEPAVTREMLDIEAHLEVVVADARRAARELRRIVEQRGGTVTAESVRGGERGGEATLTLRVPARDSDAILVGIHGLGEVGEQRVTARDVGKEYFDAGILLASLELTLARYQKLLDRAATLQEVLQLEDQLARIRTQIEQVKGNLRFLRDRVARATIHVTLCTVPELGADSFLHPGVRATTLVDLRDSGTDSYFGGGLSFWRTRALTLEVDALRGFDSDTHGIDGLLVAIGGDFYSARFGGGENRFLNPYLGYRLGYARLPDEEDAFVFGGVVGLELLKTELFTLEADVAGLGFLGDHKAHFAVQPSLGANIAF